MCFMNIVFVVTVDGDDEIIHQYLETVGLSHLSRRTGGLDVQVDWNW